jgi:hypothetical protein
LHGQCPLYVRWFDLAEAQLRAVADGNVFEAEALTAQLAEAVLRSEPVRMALAVRQGGPLAVARGVQLAQLVLHEGTRLIAERRCVG